MITTSPKGLQATSPQIVYIVYTKSKCQEGHRQVLYMLCYEYYVKK